MGLVVIEADLLSLVVIEAVCLLVVVVVDRGETCWVSWW